MTCKDIFISNVDIAEARLDKLVAEMESFDDMIAKQQSPTLYLNPDNVRTATTMLNTILRAPGADLSGHPQLKERLDQGPLTTAEVGDFAITQGYVPLTAFINDISGYYDTVVQELADINQPVVGQPIVQDPNQSKKLANPHDRIPEIVGQLNTFFAGNYAIAQTGSMCGAFTDAYASINNFGIVIGKAANKLSNIENIKLSDLFNEVQPLEALKKAVDGVIDDLQKQLMDRANRVRDTAEVAIQDFNQLSVGVAQDIVREHQRLQALLADPNIDKIKKSMDKYLAAAVSQFEDVADNPEIIPYIAYRTCQTIGQAQNVLQGPVDAFADRMNNRISVISSMNRYSDEARARLGVNGGSTLTRTQIAKARQLAYNAHQGRSAGATRGNSSSRIATRPRGNMPIQYPLTGADIAIGNRWIIERNSSGRFTKVQNQWVNLQPQVMNQGIDFPQNRDDDGWTMVDERVWALVWKLGQKLGRRIDINSAYRSPAKNEHLRRTTQGVAKNSFHTKGMAIDISTRGGIDPVELIKHASLLGFTGIGGYRTFIHCDIRANKATWNSSGGPKVADALRIHMSSNVTFEDKSTSAPAPIIPLSSGTGPI